MGYPALQAGPSGIGVWGWDAVKRPVRLANMEIISILMTKNLLPRPLFSTYRGNQFWGYNGTAGYTLPALFPPPPPLLIPPGSLRGRRGLLTPKLTVCWSSHFFHISWERGGGGGQRGQGLSIQHDRGRHLEHSGCGSKSEMKEWHRSHFIWPFLLE